MAVQHQKQVSIQRQGADSALTVLCRTFAESLPEQVPALWTVCVDALKAFDPGVTGDNGRRILIDPHSTHDLITTL